MQEDRQPNEIRIQRKGDHRVPTVRSSASLGRYRQSRPSDAKTRFKPKKSLRNTTPRDRDGGVVAATYDHLGAQGSERGRRRRYRPLRRSVSAQDISATNLQPATGSAFKPLSATTAFHPGPPPETSRSNGALHASGLITDTQKSSRGPQERLVIGSQGRDTSRNMPEKSSSFVFARDRPHHLNDAPHIFQSTSDRSSTEPVKQEVPVPQPNPATFPPGTSREGAIRRVPNDIIDLTLDSSDDEHPDTLTHAPSERVSSDPSTHQFLTDSTILGPKLNLVKNPRDKPRLFVRYTLGSEACLANISAHGFVDQICMVPRWGRETIRSPDDPTLELVHDACALSAYGTTLLVLAHCRDNIPVTIHRLGHQSPIRLIGSHDRPAMPGKPKGLSAICSMIQPLSFATGGVDHAIHIWNVDHNLQAVRSQSPLIINHTSRIYSLLPIHDSSHKLVSSGADCRVNVYDLSCERVVNMTMLSNPGFHIHRLGNPSALLIQTAHREHQFEIRDLRTGSMDETLRFGFTSDNLRLSRFARGDVAHSTLFACGDPTGVVHIWDLRNIKQPATQMKCFNAQIRNVIWHESHILASSDDNEMAAIPYNYANSVI